jgi:hypothetical protein
MHSYRYACLAALALLLAGPAAEAQTAFTEFALTDSTLNSSPATDFWISSAAPADVDADGDLDLLVAGYYVVYPDTSGNGTVEHRLTFYRNDGPVGDSAWALTPLPVDIGDLSFGGADIAWGDYDLDGDPDAVVASDEVTTLFRNDGGTLVRTSTALPAYYEDGYATMDLRSLSWADYDNDGDPDLLVPSVVDFENFWYDATKLLRNDGAAGGDAWAFTDTEAALDTTSNGLSAWADMDADGDLDLLLGEIQPNAGLLNIYRNDDGTLVPADTGLAHIRYGMADWGDADGDGDLDVVYVGNIDLPDGTGETVVRILLNEGPGVPYDSLLVLRDGEAVDGDAWWLDFHAVSWADYDSDGDMDLLVGGSVVGDGEIYGLAAVYTNTGGAFEASGLLPGPIDGLNGGTFTWFDVDTDGDLDYFVAGAYFRPDGNGLVEARTQLFRNDAAGANLAPSAPGNLVATPAPGGVDLRWGAAGDDGTPTAALTYRLDVTPLATAGVLPEALPEPGNVSGNTAWSLRGLPDGTYRVRVRALDAAFAAGPLAEATVTIGAVAAEPGAGDGARALSAVVPNPAAAAAAFTLTLDRAQAVTVAVYDALGRRVALLAEGELAAGPHALALDAAPLAPGAYVVRASGDGFALTRRLTVAR